MKLKQTPDLLAFLSTYFPDADMDADSQTAQSFVAASSPDKVQQVVKQARLLLAEAADFPVEEFGSEANRWFADADEARAWLELVLSALDAGGADSSDAEVAVKDSNGALLSEGDSVQVIKDLKVRGGTSDLKRGTLIKKIHLIGDPENIECRVDGSTLVLKTCFLKKA